jgi:predicted MFS family arabinose efflux permease
MQTLSTYLSRTRQRPEILLYLMTVAVPFSFAAWLTLLNNFAIERADFTGVEMGILQSLREIPGFLSFAVVFVLLLVREQRLALLSLLLLGIGTALTGYFPSVLGLYCTTVLMSLGYHYYETVQTSLSLQWIDKARAPETLGRIIAVRSFASIATFGLVWLAFDKAGLDYDVVYLLGGGITVVVALICWTIFPRFSQPVVQHKHLVLRPRYWLYYALTFMSGARRQIFVVFASFLMVEKFGYSVEQIAILYLVNAAFSVWLAPRIGRLIARWGERKALVFEYIGLIVVFIAYAFVDDGRVAVALFIVDHVFFAMAIAIKTYFQKIADPADIASTAGVSFTINHIAAVAIPAAFGFLWLVSPAFVFLAGAAMAGLSLILAFNVPRHPVPGREVLIGRRGVPATAE